MIDGSMSMVSCSIPGCIGFEGHELSKILFPEHSLILPAVLAYDIPLLWWTSRFQRPCQCYGDCMICRSVTLATQYFIFTRRNFFSIVMSILLNKGDSSAPHHLQARDSTNSYTEQWGHWSGLAPLHENCHHMWSIGIFFDRQFNRIGRISRAWRFPIQSWNLSSKLVLGFKAPVRTLQLGTSNLAL